MLNYKLKLTVNFIWIYFLNWGEIKMQFAIRMGPTQKSWKPNLHKQTDGKLENQIWE